MKEDDAEKSLPYILRKLLENKRRKKVSKKNRLKSKGWICSKCRMIFIGREKVINPAPCIRCGGIAFEVVPVGTRLVHIVLCPN